MATITGTAFDDIITPAFISGGVNGFPTSNDDTIYGLAGNDTVDGGLGNDSLRGGDGNDTYLFAPGGGVDSVYENVAEGLDTISLAAGYTSADVRFVRSSTTLQIVLGAAGDRIDIGSQYDSSGAPLAKVETLAFADGSSLSLTGGLTFTGTAASESVYGTTESDILKGMAGNDTLYGGDGNDTYEFAPGDGVDTVYENFDEGLDIISVAAGYTSADVRFFRSSATLQVFLGAAGDRIDVAYQYDSSTGAPLAKVETLAFADGSSLSLTGGLTFTGTAASETVSGTTKNDVLLGLGSNDTLYGYAGADIIDGGEGDDRLYGGTGNDTLKGRLGNDTLSGEDGNDIYTFAPGDGVDTIYENFDAGFDTISVAAGYTSADVRFFRSSTTLQVFLGAAGDRIDVGSQFDYSGAPLAKVETLAFADGSSLSLTGGLTFTGTAAPETISGSTKNDVIRGMAGNDTLYGLAGSDTLIGGPGADTMQGGNGTDTASYAGSAVGVTVSLAGGAGSGGDAQGDTFNSVENLVGSSGNDILTGNGAANNLDGGEGDDTINGGVGNDTINGGAGDDTLIGGAGNDTLRGALGDDVLDGGDGIDTATYFGTANVNVDLRLTTPQNTRIGFDTLTGIETVIGGSGNDTLIGDDNANTLEGSAGNDTLTGNGGADVFRFAAALNAATNVDTITDFDAAADLIHLARGVFTALAAGALPASAFVVGAAAADADDRIIYDAATGHVSYDADGVGGSAAIHFATLTGSPAIAADDFLIV